MTKASSSPPAMCVAAATAMLALTTTTGVESFSTTSTPVMMPSTTQSTTRLHLLPEQGKQLEAAMNAALAKAEAQKELCEIENDEDEGCTPSPLEFVGKQESGVSRSARAFISKMFSLPSYIRTKKSAAAAAGDSSAGGMVYSSSSFDDQEWESYTEEKPGDDVVLFPLVGFRFVQDSPNHYGVLPSSGACNPSCRLPPINKDEEEVVGWYSKACHLDLYGENYCQDPSTLKEE